MARLHDLGTPAEDLHRGRQDKFLRDLRHGIMIATDLEHGNAGLMQALHLRRQKPRRLHRGLFAVIEIARNNQRIDGLIDAEIDDPINAWRVAIPHQCRKLALRSASERSGESRWRSAVWTNRKGIAWSTGVCARLQPSAVLGAVLLGRR